ncbi:hypothetical protein [Rudanella lutea]|jgi:hypothetical protein|uniref:glycine-rich domain-containing protein n=1 Tax=Rudanella lutea TaxID=451374 RepID=UPI000378C37C|nr:hypothetical protein [Rudanella lutea]
MKINFIQLFTLFFLLVTSRLAQAQQSYALKPYAITLPRVTTPQQTNPATVPQNAGNLVYNTTEQKVAVNNGSQWEYLATAGDVGSQFANFTVFNYTSENAQQLWTIPAGVTRFLVEAWGGGGGGVKYLGSSNVGDCRGGASGGYAQKLYAVQPNGPASVSVVVGRGGSGTTVTGNPGSAQGGGASQVYYPFTNNYLFAGAGNNFAGNGGITFVPSDGFRPLTMPGMEASVCIPLSYVQKDASNYIITVKMSDGGTAYGVPPGRGGIGNTVMLQNNSTASGNLVFIGWGYLGENGLQDGSFPGGGGGCGYYGGGNGAPGMVIIRW